jgi:hypothetical protein
MSTATSEALNPIGESQAAERRERLDHLAFMVFNFITERHGGGTDQEFEDVEDAGLIAALRVCAYYTEQIGCLDFGDAVVVQVKGIDGHEYIIQFSLLESRHSIHVARVQVTKRPMVGREGQAESTYNRMNVLHEPSMRLKLSKLTTDRAFLIGMSLFISFIDDGDEGSDEEDVRLAPLLALTMPTPDEWREIRAKKLPPSTINYDDEGEMPY